MKIDEDLYEKRHKIIGQISLILAIVTLMVFLIGVAIMFVLSSEFTYFYWHFLVTILATLDITLGAITYCGPFRNLFGLTAFIIGVILLCISPVMMFLSSYLYMANF